MYVHIRLIVISNCWTTKTTNHETNRKMKRATTADLNSDASSHPKNDKVEETNFNVDDIPNEVLYFTIVPNRNRIHKMRNH